jgi:penicillin-binding protein 1A
MRHILAYGEGERDPGASSIHLTKMRVFTWKGEVDTLMSPMDSIRYYKALPAKRPAEHGSAHRLRESLGGRHRLQALPVRSRGAGARQVGSTFKPFVYATAMREGMDLCREVPNQKGLLRHAARPAGLVSGEQRRQLRWHGHVEYALANSMNTVTAWLMKQYGPQAVTVLARHMGVKSPLDPVPSLCLGVADLTLMEMTGAFSSFANQGVYIEPITFTRIEDKNGNAVYDVTPKTDEALDERTAYKSCYKMLKV